MNQHTSLNQSFSRYVASQIRTNSSRVNAIAQNTPSFQFISQGNAEQDIRRLGLAVAYLGIIFFSTLTLLDNC